MLNGIGMVVAGIIFSILIYICKAIFSKSKNIIDKQVNENIKPFIKNKERDFKENKLLKLKELLNNDIISPEEYTERSNKINLK